MYTEVEHLILKILFEYSDEDHILSQKKICYLLESKYGIRLSRRSFYRHIETLINCGEDISTWNENRSGYYIMSPQLDITDALHISYAINSCTALTQAESNRIEKNILSLAGPSATVEFFDSVFLENRSKSQNPQIMINLQKLQFAAYFNYYVTFSYFHYNSSKEQISSHPHENLEPRYFVYHNNRPYMITTGGKHNNPTVWRIDRIKSLVISDKRFSTTFTKDEAWNFIGNSPYMFGGKQVSATFLCKNKLLDYVIDEFGKDVSIHPANHEHFYLHFKSSEANILFFAQQYLDAATLIDPPELKNKFIEHLADSISKYQANSPD